MKKKTLFFILVCLALVLVSSDVLAKDIQQLEFNNKIKHSAKLSLKLKHVLQTNNNEQVKSIVVMKKGAKLSKNNKIRMKQLKNLHDIVFVDAAPQDFVDLFENPDVEKLLVDEQVKIPELGTLSLDEEDIETILSQHSELSGFLSNFTGSGVKVAIVDTGIDNELGFNVVYEQDWTEEGTDDLSGHGTFMWSVASSKAPFAEYLDLKVLNHEGQGYMSDVLSALDVALDPNNDGSDDDSADVILLSLGIDPATAEDPDAVAFFTESVNNIAQKAVVVVSVGNGGPDHNTIFAPADAADVLSIGAVDAALENVAVFSSRGPAGELVKPNYVAPGSFVEGLKPAGVDFGIAIDETHAYASGTSVSAAYGVGVAALILEKGEDVSDVFSTYAVDLGASESAQGQGLVSMEEQVDLGEYDQVFWKIKHVSNRDTTAKTEQLCVIIPPETTLLDTKYVIIDSVSPLTLKRDPYFFTNEEMLPLSPVEGNNMFELILQPGNHAFVNFTFGKFESDLWPEIWPCDAVASNGDGGFVKALSTQEGEFTKHVLDSNFNMGNSVYAADIDNNGHMDILATGSGESGFIWWKNEGQALGWIENSVATEYDDGSYFVQAADMDGDDDLDMAGVVSVEDVGSIRKIIWSENDNLDFSSNHIVEDDFNGGTYAFAVDINGASLDMLGDNGASVYWWESFNSGTTWSTEKTILTSGTPVVKSAQINGDGKSDAVVVNIPNNLLSWIENVNNGASWSEHLILASGQDIFEFQIADLDSDGDDDIITSSAPNGVKWWENKNNGTNWNNYQIAQAQSRDYSTLYVADINGDGYKDVIGSDAQTGDITWWENGGGSGDDINWVEHTVYASTNCVTDFFTADVDTDGDTDIIAMFGYNNELVWWENPSSVPEFIIKNDLEEVVTGPLYAAPGNEIDVVVKLSQTKAFVNTPVLNAVQQTYSWAIEGDEDLTCLTPELGICTYTLTIDVPTVSGQNQNTFTVSYDVDDYVTVTKQFVIEKSDPINPSSFDVDIVSAVVDTITSLPNPSLDEQSVSVSVTLDNEESNNVDIELNFVNLGDFGSAQAVKSVTLTPGTNIVSHSFNVYTDTQVGTYWPMVEIKSPSGSLLLDRLQFMFRNDNPIPISGDGGNGLLETNERFYLGRLFGFHSVTASGLPTLENNYFVSPGLTYYTNVDLTKRSKPTVGGDSVDQSSDKWGVDSGNPSYTDFTSVVNWLKSYNYDFKNNEAVEVCVDHEYVMYQQLGRPLSFIEFNAYLRANDVTNDDTGLSILRIPIPKCPNTVNLMSAYSKIAEKLELEIPDDVFGNNNFLNFDFSIKIPDNAQIEDTLHIYAKMRVYTRGKQTHRDFPFYLGAEVWYDYLTVTTTEIYNKADDNTIELAKTTTGWEKVNLVDEFTKRRNGKVVLINDFNNVPFWFNSEINIDYCSDNACREEKTVNKKLYVNMYLKNHLQDEKKPLDAEGITPYVLIIGNDNDIPYSRVKDPWVPSISDYINLGEHTGEPMSVYNSKKIVTAIDEFMNLSLNMDADLSYEGNTYRSDVATADLDDSGSPDIIISRLPRQFEDLSFINEYLKYQIKPDSATANGVVTVVYDDDFSDAKDKLQQEYGNIVSIDKSVSSSTYVKTKLEQSRVNYLLLHGSPLFSYLNTIVEFYQVDQDGSYAMPDSFVDDSVVFSIGCANAYPIPKHVMSEASSKARCDYDSKKPFDGRGKKKSNSDQCEPYLPENKQRLEFSQVHQLFWKHYSPFQYRDNLGAVIASTSKTQWAYPVVAGTGPLPWTEFMGEDFTANFAKKTKESDTVGDSLFKVQTDMYNKNKMSWSYPFKSKLRKKLMRQMNLYGDPKNEI